jgi:glycosyltransferase involved in cell wall biosynthesis
MKVIQVTTLHPWNDSRIYKKIVLSLVDAGFKVDYLAPISKGPIPHLGDVNIHWLPNYSGISGRVIRNILAFIKITKIKARLVHFHDPEFLPFAFLLRLFGRKLIYDIHEDNLLALQQKEYSQLLPHYFRLLIAKSFTLLEQIASRAMAQVIAEKCYRYRFPKATAVLNYPNTNKRIKSPPKLSTNNGIKLIYTGVVSKDRGAFHMIRLIKALKGAELYIVGKCDKNLLQELILFAEEDLHRIRFKTSHEHVPFSYIEEKYSRYNWTAGLAIFPQTPHYYEKELTKFFEYMYYGIPILCSDFPVWHNLIVKNRVGFVVNPDDIESSVDIVKRLSENESLRAKIAQRGEELVMTKYNWKLQFKNLYRLYNQILQN